MTIQEDGKSFSDLGVDEHITAALAANGITSPFEIQILTIPLALKNKDLIAQGKTGSGKTLAFSIPLAHKLATPATKNLAPGQVRGLVVVPTRELAAQVAGEISTITPGADLKVGQFYGGKSLPTQIRELSRGIDIAVGTPGRLLDLMKQKKLDLSQVELAVLDEADEMLDLGFYDAVTSILDTLPKQRQTLLFSATIAPQVLTLARAYMNDPIQLSSSNPLETEQENTRIEHFYYRVHQLDKPDLLAKILQADGLGKTIIFAQTKRNAHKLFLTMQEKGFAVATIHGDLPQDKREQALKNFRSGKRQFIIATDVAARGIDVDDITHVINYDCPGDENTFVHRVGRTARAGKDGIAITFVEWEDAHRWKQIVRALELENAEPVETYSTSGHIHHDLAIPEDAKTTLASTTPVTKPRTNGERRNGERRNGERRRTSGERRKPTQAPSEAPTEQVSERREPKRRVRTRKYEK